MAILSAVCLILFAPYSASVSIQNLTLALSTETVAGAPA